MRSGLGRWTLALLLGAAMLPSGAYADPDDQPAAGAAPGVVKLDAAALARAGIEVAPVKPASGAPAPVGYGAVLDLAGLATLADGYAAAAAQVQAAEAKLAASRDAFERAQRLNRAEQNVSTAELQTADTAFRTDQATLAAATAQLRGATATAARDWGPVLGGEVASGGARLQRLLDGQEVLVQVTVPSATGSPPSAASVEIAGRSSVALHYVSPAARADPHVSGAGYLFTTPADGRLLPGMTVSARLSDGPADGAMVVPETAVVRWQGADWIYVRAAAGSFTRRPVETGRPAPGGGYLVDGLGADATIVVRGAQLLLSEEFKGQGEDEN